MCKDGQHFGVIVLTAAGALSIRPHPGKDPNGWGSSLYLQAFLSGQTVLAGASRSVEGIASTGITVNASGPVNAPASTTYGTWSWQMAFAYDPAARVMTTAGGTYSVSLDGLLSVPAQDLNVARIASNYLHDVPLLNPPGTNGDTGDMQEVVVSNGLNQTWSPPANPGFYPQDQADHMTIDVKGQYNVVDTARQGLPAIAAAYKPGLTLTLANQATGLPMIFGAAYDTAKSRSVEHRGKARGRGRGLWTTDGGNDTHKTWIETHSDRPYRFFACLPPPSSTWTWTPSSRRWSNAILPSCAASP